MAEPIKINRQIIANGIGEILNAAAPRNTRAILFGSRARGDARQDSDWDVLILLDKDHITSADMDDISYPIRELGWNIDEIINPIMYNPQNELYTILQSNCTFFAFHTFSSNLTSSFPLNSSKVRARLVS